MKLSIKLALGGALFIQLLFGNVASYDATAEVYVVGNVSCRRVLGVG